MDMLTRTICMHDAVKPIQIDYSDNNTYYGDTMVVIYDDYKISLVLTDDCGAVIGDNVFFPKRGDMIIFRPNEIHFGRFPKSSEYRFISIFIPTDFFDCICPSGRQIMAPFFDNSDEKVNLIRLSEEAQTKMIALAEELCVMIKDENTGVCTDLIAFARIIDILKLCSDFYPLQKEALPKLTVPPLITKTIRKIDEHFPEDIGLHGLAEHCGCSITYLTQTFKKYTGKSIHGYITERRLEHARKLLKSGASVTEACYQSGFGDCSRFISLFSKQFGMTPGKYKKESAVRK